MINYHAIFSTSNLNPQLSSAPSVHQPPQAFCWFLTKMLKFCLFLVIITGQLLCSFSTAVHPAEDPSESIGCLNRCSKALSTISFHMAAKSAHIERSCRDFCTYETRSARTLTWADKKTMNREFKPVCCKWCPVTYVTLPPTTSTTNSRTRPSKPPRFTYTLPTETAPVK